MICASSGRREIHDSRHWPPTGQLKTACKNLLQHGALLLLLACFGSTSAHGLRESPNTLGSQASESSVSPTIQRVEVDASSPIDPMLKDTETSVKRGDYAYATKTLLSYVANHADSADAHFLLGYAFYRENRPKDSLAEYTLGAQLRKPDAKDLAVVAMDYLLLHDYADADKWLSIATAWHPENALYWYYLGRTKYNENRFQEAIDAFEKCLLLYPRAVRAEYNMGLAYAGLNRNSDASTAYKTAIAWQTDAVRQDPQPYLDLGMLLLQTRDVIQALSYLRKAAELDVQNPRIHEELGKAYERLHDLSNAESEIQKAISLAPNIAPLHYQIGRIYQREGRVSKAKEEFARCATLNATHSTDMAETPNPDTGNER